ncbi:hypothetical protein ABBQ32_012215 [Trebouxia sp. C0010 RCD-2024]
MSVAQAVARLGHAPARLCNLHSVTPGRIGLPTWRLLPGLRALRSASGHAELGGHRQTLTTSSAVTVSREDVITGNQANNVTDNIFQKIGVNLHQQPNHPICIIKEAIIDYFETNYPGRFKSFDDLYPIVSTKANFDDVLTPVDHVSRNPNDTYYVDKDTVLRCHTSAHQAELLRKGETSFLLTGDVYRRDSIDASHYPVFHQMEGLYVLSDEEIAASGKSGTELAAQELQHVLSGLTKHLFGEVEMKFVDAYFPFTEPSYELEIFFQGEWLEVLGCGVTQRQILEEAGHAGKTAWAFGLGLERLAMVLFDIPDIRLFWSNDKRFTKQFKQGQMRSKFKPYSKYPPCYKDVSFWLPTDDSFTENNLCEQVRNIAGDLVEEVKLIDSFTHPKKQRTSHCYRIAYRSMERSLTDEEINALQEQTRTVLANEMKVELR